MTAEFLDTNILLYAQDRREPAKHQAAQQLISRLLDQGTAAVSTQVLIEFYAAGTRKLKMSSDEAEAILSEMRGWLLHRPTLADILKAADLQRRHQFSWFDSLIVQSALELDCSTLWSEDLAPRRLPGGLKIRNPFA
jgi:predicted nucleic acid-binding protein